MLKSPKVSLCIVSAIFALFSKIVFDQINRVCPVVVDEEFHLPLGEAYCQFEYDKWHPKITTLPGLYLVSSVLLGPFGLCSTYWLRFISLIASVLNITLFYLLLSLNNDEVRWKNVFSALNLALLPPLYFFSHFYYTDVLSVTSILLLFITAQKGNHYLASIFGFISILFRQTNVIWIGMVFGCYVLRDLHVINTKKPSGVPFRGLKLLLKKLPVTLKSTTLQFWLNFSSYSALLFCFLLFVIWNGSIVVGDKTAHEATIHLPQIFYFSLFCLIFAWPHFVGELTNFVRSSRSYKPVLIISTVLALIVVYCNTVVHPYMLADNRHYVFYIWNRFYGKHFSFRYLMVPIYIYAIFVIVSKVYRKNDISFILLFIPCTVAVLATQQLLELRYFFVPFILFKSQINRTTSTALICEFFTYLSINFVTLYLFFNKTIQWEDYDYPQRLIW